MNLRTAILIFILNIFFCFNQAHSKHILPEKYYQNEWCQQNNGISEVKMIDNTRIDCLTNTHAVEFDFAPKWAEAIGQSLHYSRLSGKKPAIVLIIEKDNDFKHYNKIKPLCEEYEIALSYVKTPKKPINQKEKSILEEIIEIIINLIYQFLKKLEPLL